MTAQRLRLLDGRLAICRMPAGAAIPPPGPKGAVSAVLRTPAETTLVCSEADAPPGARVAAGWRALEVQGPFELTGSPGVLASLAEPLARAGVSVFALSTFDTDYLLVPGRELASARAALTAAGHSFAEGAPGGLDASAVAGVRSPDQPATGGR